MDTENIKSALFSLKEKHLGTIEQQIEGDVTLPDYCSDIIKILPAKTYVNITSAVANEGSVTIEGEIICLLTYAGEGGKIECFEYKYPFTKTEQVKDAVNTDTVIVTYEAAKVSLRAVASKRVDIRGGVTLKLAVLSLCETELITQMEGCHTLKNTVSGIFPVALGSKRFSISLDSDIPDELANAKITATNISYNVAETRIIKNKMMIKGSVSAVATLMADDGSCYPKRLDEPFNQILELSGIDENIRADVSLYVQSVSSVIAPAIQSRNRLEVNISLLAATKCFKESSVEIITDAYSSRCEIALENSSIDCIISSIQINDNYSVSDTIPTNGSNPIAATSCYANGIKTSFYRQEDNLVIKSVINMCVITTDEDNNKQGYEKAIEAIYKKPIDKGIDEFSLLPIVTVNAAACSVSKDKITVSAELHIEATAYAKRRLVAVTDYEVGAMKAKGDEGTITVYFATAGEDIWSIAKTFGASPERIRDHNSAAEDTLTKDTMLVFELE